MKVLLINSPIRLEAQPNCIPYGLATIASVLRKQGHDAAIYDVNAHRPTKDEILETLQGMQWDIVGVSGLITTFAFQMWLIPHLKAMNPHAPVVSGGGLATSNAELLLSRAPVDFAVVGEGEHTMMEICRAVEHQEDLEKVPGIAFKRGKRIFCTEPRQNISHLDGIPLPAWDLLPMDIYLQNPIWGDMAHNSSGFRRDISVHRSMNVIASRGCPFACNYCYHLFGRSDYRFRSPQNIVAEIEALVNAYQVDFVGFVDDNMMASGKRMLEFCALMEQRRFPLTWGCHGRVTSAKPSLLERMAGAGCVWIGYGIESGSQEILDRMNKKCTVAQAKQAIKDTRAAGMFPNTTFIFGYPGETRETIQATIDFKRDMGIACGSFFATPYPGTPLYADARARIGDEESFIRSLGDATVFSVNLTDMDDETLFRLKDKMDKNQYV